MVGKAYPGDSTMSYSLEVNDIKHFANPDEEEADLVSVVMSIMGLDDQMVQVDDIHIKLLKGADSAVSGNFFKGSTAHKETVKTNEGYLFSASHHRRVPGPFRRAGQPMCHGHVPVLRQAQCRHG